MIIRAEDELEAGTGFMLQLAEGIQRLEILGFTENLSIRYDHFEARSGEVKLYPGDFKIDGMLRFENSSDPDDQSILYAVSSRDGKVKGAHVESYGLYHEELSPEMLKTFKNQLNTNSFR
jgi:hypothetical protein